MITANDKKVTHASHSKASRLQARLRETSNPKNAKTRSSFSVDLKPYLRIKSDVTTININI